MKISKQPKKKEITTFTDTSNYLSSNSKYSIQINSSDEIIDIEFKDMHEVKELYDVLSEIIGHDTFNNNLIHDITIHDIVDNTNNYR